MFLVPPPATAPNSCPVRWKRSPKRTGAYFSISTIPAAVFPWIPRGSPAHCRKFISISAASWTANSPASAWFSTRAASARKSSSTSASRTSASSPIIRKKSSLSKATASASPTRCRCASSSPAPRTRPYDPAHNIYLDHSGLIRASSSSHTLANCHSERSEESLLWFVWRLFYRSSRLRRGWRGLRRPRSSDGQVLAHFLEPLRSQPANREQIIHALEGAVCFSHLQNLAGRGGPDPGHLLQFLGRRRIEVHRPRRRFFLCGKNRH